MGNHANQLIVDEFLDAQVGELAPVARVLNPAKWQLRAPGRMIDEDHSGLNLKGHALASFYVGDGRFASARESALNARVRLDDPGVPAARPRDARARPRRVIPRLVGGTRSVIRCYNEWTC